MAAKLWAALHQGMSEETTRWKGLRSAPRELNTGTACYASFIGFSPDGVPLVCGAANLPT